MSPVGQPRRGRGFLLKQAADVVRRLGAILVGRDLAPAFAIGAVGMPGHVSGFAQYGRQVERSPALAEATARCKIAVAVVRESLSACGHHRVRPRGVAIDVVADVGFLQDVA